MKKLIVVVLTFLTLNVFAQNQNRSQREMMRHEQRTRMSDLTAEEHAAIQTKKMTLRYDLSKDQQEKVMALNLEAAKHYKEQQELRNTAREFRRKERKDSNDRPNAIRPKISKEEHLKHMHERLDRQIAHKTRMKEILNEDQYREWEATLNHKQKSKQKRKQNRIKRRHRDHRSH